MTMQLPIEPTCQLTSESPFLLSIECLELMPAFSSPDQDLNKPLGKQAWLAFSYVSEEGPSLTVHHY